MDLAAIKQVAESEGTVVDQALFYPLSEAHTLHVDGDYAAYFFAGNDDLALGIAKDNLVNSIKSAAAVLGVFNHNVTVHITDPMSDKGSRYKIATVRDYQEKRTHTQRPRNWQYLREFLHAGLPGSGLKVTIWMDREADDGAAYAAALDIEESRIPGLYYRDKDWRMIPGRHIRWTDFEVFDTINSQFSLTVQDNGEDVVYGTKFFWLQMLMGDTVDNIPGLEKLVYINPKGVEKTKQCGEVCATEQLADAVTDLQAYEVVSAAYRNFYGPGWEVRFAEQAMLLWLRRSEKPEIANFLLLIADEADDRPGLVAAVIHIARRIRQ